VSESTTGETKDSSIIHTEFLEGIRIELTEDEDECDDIMYFFSTLFEELLVAY